MTARIVLGSILWILCSEALPCPCAEVEPSAPAIVAGPCLQNPGKGSMTIVWMTDRNCSAWVEYGQDEALDQKAVSSRDGLIDAYQRLHRVTLRGLEAGRTYRYRVVSREIVDFKPYQVTYGATVASEIYPFTALDPQKSSFSFIVLNDLHDKVDIMKRLLALADREPYDFVVLNGDIINDPQSEEQVVRVVLQPCGETFGTRAPLVLVRGNHETRGKYARELKPFVRDPDDHYYGAFTHGGVRLVILDSGEDKPDSEPVYADLVDFDRYREAQREWLEEEIRGLEFRESRFQIALVHIPLFGSGDRHGAADCRQKWGPLLQEGGADLHIAAHLHRHRILDPEPGLHDYPVVIGGAPSPGAATLTRVTVGPTALRVTVLNDEGETVGTCEVSLEDRDRQSLLRGVSRVDAIGLPGPLCVFGESAFPVAATTSTRGGGAPIVAAARLGRGRVVAFGHPDYIGEETGSSGDVSVLVKSAARWTSARGGGPIRVGVPAGDAEAERCLKAHGLEVVVLGTGDWRSGLRDCHVVCLRDTVEEWADHVDALSEFVAEGGGALVAGFGLGWLEAHPGRSLAEEHPGNRLLAPAGIVFAHGSAVRRSRGRSSRGGRGSGGGSATVTTEPSRWLHAGRALEALRDGAELAESERSEAGATLANAVASIPSGDRLLRPKLAGLRKEYADALVPTAARPISADSSPVAWLLLRMDVEEAERLPPEEVRAHPAAGEFPGPVPSDAERVGRSIVIDTDAAGWHNFGIYGSPRSQYWHSTGLYAAPGEVVRVTVDESAVDRGLFVRIGAHSDSLLRSPSWQRAPSICRRFALLKSTVLAASAFGGLIYIEVPYDLEAGKISVRIENAVEAPRYILSQTPIDEWRTRIRLLPAPWAELETAKVILTLPSEAIRTLDDPESLMRFWDQILDCYAHLLGRPTERRRVERFVSDVQISAGYMHSGYPLMTMLDIVPTMVDKDRIASNGHHGVWGLFHEIGHNHQNADWTFGGTTEVTVNLFSLYVMETICGITEDAHPGVKKESRERSIQKYLGGGADFEEWKRDPFLALAMYIQLREAFGWDAFTRVFSEYRDLAASARPRNDDEKRDQWLVRFSRAVGHNLGPFFRTWGLPTSEAARESIADLPAWMPEGFPPP